MLSKFSVEGFKAFNQKFVLDLSTTCNYEFNSEAVKDGIVNRGIIYGFNSCGKSNLGLALFDIISHITDKNCDTMLFSPYLNLDAEVGFASFEYCFVFKGKSVVYRYKKSDLETLIWESLWIDNREVLQYDFLKNQGFVKLAGAQQLDLVASSSNISRVKYVRSNAILQDNVENQLFLQFIRFVDDMLLFFSLDMRGYLGFRNGADSIGPAIIRAGKTKDFERFLKNNNINLDLSEKDVDGEPLLVVRYRQTDVSFFRVVSSGTKSLAVFFYWYILMEKASFVFMDEFDAFYHFELSESIVEMLKKFNNTQILFTTHNTDLLSNDLLRPDCFFWMNDGKIASLASLTEKELRKAHNLQKMFKAGAFRA